MNQAVEAAARIANGGLKGLVNGVLRNALRTFARAEEEAGRGVQFRALEPFLSPDAKGEASYETAAQVLGLTEESVRQVVSRMRKKFRDTLRAHIADTLNDPDEKQIDDELAALKAALLG